MNIEHFGGDGIFTNPSGVLANTVEVAEWLMKCDGMRYWKTKTLTPEAREGNDAPIYGQLPKDFPGWKDRSYFNAVGYRNPGIEKFIESADNCSVSKDRTVVSIGGGDKDEFVDMAKRLYDVGFKMVELNVSCPHVEGHGKALIKEQNYELIGQIIKEIKDKTGLGVMVKGSNSFNIPDFVRTIVRAGADGLSLINTIGPNKIEVDGHAVLSNKIGGISGRYDLEPGIEAVREAGEVLTELGVKNFILEGIGGIFTAEDIYRYEGARANVVAPGTAGLTGLNKVQTEEYYHTLYEDYNHGTNRVEQLLSDFNLGNLFYRRVRIDEIINLASDLKVFKFKEELKAKPGQYMALWLPDIAERAFSIYNSEKLEVLFQVNPDGKLTKEMVKMKRGDEIYVKGPLGASPEVEGKLLLVGAGTGAAGIRMLSERNRNTVEVIGARDRFHLPDLANWQKMGNKTYVYTDDGSKGKKGSIVSELGEIIIEENPDQMLVCGPEIVLDISKRMWVERGKDPDKFWGSRENLMLCHAGVCASCVCVRGENKGKRACVDGPFLKNY